MQVVRAVIPRTFFNENRTLIIGVLIALSVIILAVVAYYVLRAMFCPPQKEVVDLYNDRD